MKPAKQLQEGKGAFELIEEAFHLLRLAPAATLASYYLGSLPFVLVLLFFWSDMSRSAFAEQRLAAGALGLALFFFWMKIWQAVFAQELLARLSGEAAPGWTFSRLLRMGLVQCIVQPSGLFLLPIALTILVPFGWTYAFYQSVTALGDGQDSALGEVLKRAWRQARLWPMQNHYVLFLLKAFGLFVFVNLITGVLGIPFLLNKFLGIETVFSQSASAMFNTTFFAAICGLTYLCVDPILKTIYVLRCFYGESLQTGRDLKAELKNLQPQRSSGGIVVALLLLSLTVSANRTIASESGDFKFEIFDVQCVNGFPRFMATMLDEGSSRREEPEKMTAAPIRIETSTMPLLRSFGLSAWLIYKQVAPLGLGSLELTPDAVAVQPRSAEGSLSPSDLDRSIDEVLHQREFSWRMPREKLQEKEDTKRGTLAAFFDSIWETVQSGLREVGHWVENFLRWLGKYFRPRPSTGGGGGTGWISALYALLWLVAIALVCAVVFLIFRGWRSWQDAPADLAAEAIVPAPDLADENVGADELPEDGWLKLARELLEKGELRLALRAFYLASLAHLAESNLITIAKFKSNHDYESELQRRAHAFPEMLNTFARNVSIFDRVWYGLHEVNPELVADFAGNVERIRLPV